MKFSGINLNYVCAGIYWKTWCWRCSLWTEWQRDVWRPVLHMNFYLYYTHTHTTILLLFWNMSGTTRVSRYQKGKTRKVKTSLDLLEREIVSGSDICWAMCKSAPHPRQPRQHPTPQFFTGRMPLLPPNQQRQSTEGILMCTSVYCQNYWFNGHAKIEVKNALVHAVNSPLCELCFSVLISHNLSHSLVL